MRSSPRAFDQAFCSFNVLHDITFLTISRITNGLELDRHFVAHHIGILEGWTNGDGWNALRSQPVYREQKF